MTQEEKKRFLNQLDTLAGGRPYFYLKFCSKENYAQDVCNGNFYANTANFFREKELQSGEHGQGDKFELVLPFKTETVSLFDYKSHELVASFSGMEAKIQFKSDDNIPLVSFVGIRFRDMELLDADEHHVDFRLPFSEEEYDTMAQRFGSHCVILNARELELRVSSICKENGIDYIFDAIDYCGPNRLERMIAFAENRKERFLYKNADLSYQREYRLAMEIEMPEDHFVSLGEMKTARILTVDQLRNLYFSIEYTSVSKEG